jgi:hypothetical protein
VRRKSREGSVGVAEEIAKGKCWRKSRGENRKREAQEALEGNRNREALATSSLPHYLLTGRFVVTRTTGTRGGTTSFQNSILES